MYREQTMQHCDLLQWKMGEKTKLLDVKSQKNRKASAEEMTLVVQTDKTNKDNYIPRHLNKGVEK